MIAGSLNLNGLEDEDMQLMFEMREKTPLLFNPSGTTIRTKPGVAAKPGHIQAYNNVVMGWTEGSGLAAVMEILKKLSRLLVECRSAADRDGPAGADPADEYREAALPVWSRRPGPMASGGTY